MTKKQGAKAVKRAGFRPNMHDLSQFLRRIGPRMATNGRASSPILEDLTYIQCATIAQSTQASAI